MGYEASVRREMAVLRKMEHPGVARLVASFRWRDGAYLVLEYAAKGDLFTQITSQGVVDEACTRFWLGEVAEALRHVHRLGFVYGDLKPENILLTGVASALALPAEAYQALLVRSFWFSWCWG
jgi:serine/threonine/tyrosine protein kinase RAD53